MEKVFREYDVIGCVLRSLPRQLIWFKKQVVKAIFHTLNELLDDSDNRKKYIGDNLMTYVEDRKEQDRRYATVSDKIKTETGWYPETNFEEGIKKTIQWHLEHQDWVNEVTSGEYQKYYEEMYNIR